MHMREFIELKLGLCEVRIILGLGKHNVACIGWKKKLIQN
jgi:hypothetical protein